MENLVLIRKKKKKKSKTPKTNQSYKSLRVNCMKSQSQSHSVVSNSLRPHELNSPWNSPRQNTGVGRHSLLQGIFPTQVSCTADRSFTSWATRETQHPFSRGSSRLRNWTGASCITGRFFTSWASAWAGINENSVLSALLIRTNWTSINIPYNISIRLIFLTQLGIQT